MIRQDKRGAINSDPPPILDRLDINKKEWIMLATQFVSSFKSFIGCTNTLKLLGHCFGFTW